MCAAKNEQELFEELKEKFSNKNKNSFTFSLFCTLETLFYVIEDLTQIMMGNLKREEFTSFKTLRHDYKVCGNKLFTMLNRSERRYDILNNHDEQHARSLMDKFYNASYLLRNYKHGLKLLNILLFQDHCKRCLKDMQEMQKEKK